MPSNRRATDDVDDKWCVHVHVLGLRLNFAWRPWTRSRMSGRELAAAA
ncbi:MAG: hypothetical protein JWR13_5203 [Mycobacterium sp.]|jgi:hypothetical protein|nr:hypothetical protein [Mycobacterium sp.]MDT5313716.1 hypothetical protein [Mycobacterium sp.]